jgi:transcription elongation factor GreA
MSPVYVTKEKLEDLKKELTELKTVKRQEVADMLRQAKDYGDLSENSAYTEAREAQNQLEMKISELEEMVKNAQIISQQEGGQYVVVGSTLTVKKDGKQYTYTIVGSEEADPISGKISNESPLGKAFLGHAIDDEVIAHIPTGQVAYKIVDIH